MPRNPLIIRDARFILLTYSQIQHDAELLAENIVGLIGELSGECIVARERHADGGLHLHVLCDFQREISTRDPRKFDVRGEHPNIAKVTVGTEDDVWDYVTKDGDVIAGGLAQPDRNERTEGGRRPWQGEYSSKWAYITDAPTKEEFFNRLAAEDPRSMVCSYANITKFADWKYRPAAEEYCNPFDGEYDLGRRHELREWLETSLCDDCNNDR